ncbi:hypothetical protein [Streptomyces sp. NPDC048419]|uniref:hypothetical protein n=1 Tax=Streptomyces sp. NPDC048419 TaxID=3365547 RepID=UPI0037245C54
MDDRGGPQGMATPLEQARGGRIAVATFAAQRAEHAPFSIDGFTAVAVSAVDAYSRHHQGSPFQEQAERNMADALSTLGYVAVDVFHYMDGKTKVADLYTHAVRIAATGIWGVGQYAPEDILEESNAAALLAALSFKCSAMWDDTSEVEMLEDSYARYASDAEETRLVFARRVRQLVETESAMGMAERQLR